MQREPGLKDIKGDGEKWEKSSSSAKSWSIIRDVQFKFLLDQSLSEMVENNFDWIYSYLTV